MSRHIILIAGCAVRPGGEPSPAMQRRVSLALAVARGLTQVTFMPIGGVGRHGPAEALVMASLLERAGVDPGGIQPVPEGETTLRSLTACFSSVRRFVEEHGAVVHVCTDGYHLRRCRIILRIWGIGSRAPEPAMRAAIASTPAPRALLWMTVRDMLALIKDIPLALLWRVTRH